MNEESSPDDDGDPEYMFGNAVSVSSKNTPHIEMLMAIRYHVLFEVAALKIGYSRPPEPYYLGSRPATVVTGQLSGRRGFIPRRQRG